eukprot:8144824-Pyramimonas_sp.AAC.1
MKHSIGIANHAFTLGPTGWPLRRAERFVWRKSLRLLQDWNEKTTIALGESRGLLDLAFRHVGPSGATTFKEALLNKSVDSIFAGARSKSPAAMMGGRSLPSRIAMSASRP